MTTTLKPCFVLLKRVILDSAGSIKINNALFRKRRNSEYSYGSKNSACETSLSDLTDENHHKLRRKKKIEYYDENQNSYGETSDSESADISDDETSSKVIKEKKLKLLKTKTPKINVARRDDKSSLSEVTDENHRKLRRKKKIEYYDENQNSFGETSDSESADISDDETTSKVIKGKNFKLSKTKKPNINGTRRDNKSSLTEVTDENHCKLRQKKKSKHLEENQISSGETSNSEFTVISDEAAIRVAKEKKLKLSKSERPKINSILRNSETSEVTNDCNCRLRRKKKIDYSEEKKMSCGETSNSEFTDLSDDEASGQVAKEKKVKPKINCMHCDKYFSTYPSYLIHRRSHLFSKFKCILCRTTHRDRQSYVYHMKRLHPEVEPFLCAYRLCEESFKTQFCLRVHNKSHSRYMCRFCKKLFVRRHTMRRHVLKFH